MNKNGGELIMIKWNNPSLLKTTSFIDGRWIKENPKETFSVTNPFDGKEIAQVSEATSTDAKKAVEAGNRAFPLWKQLSPKERGKYLLKWEELIRENWEDLSTLLTLEQGKPLEQATHELMGCSGFLTWAAEEGKRICGYIPTSPDWKRRFFVTKQPVGTVAIVTPWNFPMVLPIQKSAPALAAGCTVVLKPAEDTPLSALALAYLAQEAGIPEGVFNVLVCKNPAPVGRVLVTHPSIRKFSFTGSTKTGKILGSLAAQTVKNLCLELGGNCPAIIFEDANIDRAVEATFWPKFYNAGQCCNNLNRFFVHQEIESLFVEKMEKMMDDHLQIGSGLDPKVTLGPLINESALQKVDSLVQDGMIRGATLRKGGKIPSPNALFYEPTLLTNTKPHMNLSKTELFGPVISVTTFTNEEEVISLANQTDYGLASYFFTENTKRIWPIAEALESGSIGINTCDICSELLPFGGWKESGMGRENGAIGSLDPYLEVKTVVLGGL